MTSLYQILFIATKIDESAYVAHCLLTSRRLSETAIRSKRFEQSFPLDTIIQWQSNTGEFYDMGVTYKVCQTEFEAVVEQLTHENWNTWGR